MIYFLAALVILALLGASARWNWWRPVAKGLPVLMYHKIGVPPEKSRLRKLWVSPGKFRKQMEYLKRKGYRTVTFEDLARVDHPGAKDVVITFDDGYRNNFTEAFPILKEFGFKAVFYVVSDCIGRKNLWHDSALEEPLDMMSEDEIKALSAAGMEIGGHTSSHKNLARISPEDAGKEILENKKKLEDITGKDTVSFSYPYGGFNDAAVEMVKKAGYLFAVIIKQGKNPLPLRERYKLKRLLVRGEENVFDFHLNITRGKNRF